VIISRIILDNGWRERMTPFSKGSDYEPTIIADEPAMEAEQDTLRDNLVVVADDEAPSHQSLQEAKRTLRNFCFMAVLFSANHGTIVACLSLATARLGAVGAWQSGILYLFYTGSAVLGATYVVKKFGGRNGMIAGMSLYCIYVSCFSVATSFPESERAAALTGAAFGGIGAGFLWVAQGSYFSEAAKRHAAAMAQDVSESTSYLAGIFAFIYLSSEVILRLLSSALIPFLDWRAIFGIYTIIAVVTTVCMSLAIDYPIEEEAGVPTSAFYKVTAALQLLTKDPKMKYMIGLNAVFGFAGAFLNSYVNGQVVSAALDDDGSRYVGFLSSWMALTAALLSLVTTRIPQKGPVLIVGATSFFFVAFPFVLQPDATKWNVYGLIAIYTLQGVGRASFESTLKATFADYFATESAGAFSNIILQNGLAGAIGYVLTFTLLCDKESRYCVEYSDGSLHDVLTFELIVCICAVVAVLGYWRASAIYKQEQDDRVEVAQIEEDDSA
jgi:MFS family permease